MRKMVPKLPRSLHPRQTKTRWESTSSIIQPPGNLIKPKTDKARGRPRLPTSVNIVPLRMFKRISLSWTMTVPKNWKKYSWVRALTTKLPLRKASAMRPARTWQQNSQQLSFIKANNAKSSTVSWTTWSSLSKRNTRATTGRTTSRPTSSISPMKLSEI